MLALPHKRKPSQKRGNKYKNRKSAQLEKESITLKICKHARFSSRWFVPLTGRHQEKTQKRKAMALRKQGTVKDA